MATNKTKVSHKAAVKGGAQTLSTTLDDLHDSDSPEKFHSTGPGHLRFGFTDRQEVKRRAACRIHAFGYARRIVLSAMTGELDSEGLFFDVVGLQQNLAESARLPAGTAPADAGSVRLFGFTGHMESVMTRFCKEIEDLCSPRDIPNPPTTDGLHQWAAITQRNLRSQFAGWSLGILCEELDAIADKLANPES
jgi:hypothetical protein